MLINHTPLTHLCFRFVLVLSRHSLALLPTTFGTRINITHDRYVLLYYQR